MLEEIIFKVKGSSDEPYEVVFIKDGEKLLAMCNCQAGQHGIYCKHRIEILSDSDKNIVSSNHDDVKKIIQWLKGTELEMIMKEISLAEEAVEEAKASLKKLKKKFARSMHA